MRFTDFLRTTVLISAAAASALAAVTVAGASGAGDDLVVPLAAGWWVIAGLGALTLVVGLLTTGDWARATAVRTAERFREPVVSRA